MKTTFWSWVPAGLLCMGVLVTTGGVQEQKSMPLRVPLITAIPEVVQGLHATDITISAEEQKVAGMDHYVMRTYAPEGALASAVAASVYVGYYKHQSQGHTIHSPRNCLPGGGWEPLVSSREIIRTSAGDVPVNRYLIGNGDLRALVLYWYQGRGRITANEYLVKWELLRDQALHGRSDEALVRIIVPVTTSEDEAYRFAIRIADELVPAVATALPT